MKAEYLIGLELGAFLLGFFIRDLGSLGAEPRGGRALPIPSASRRPQDPRKPW